ncbi:MAG: type II toxin-antitoxin system prevent-host-death family antitoxin [Fusobacteriaceae bacterium]|jgi:prevent-host-death family protein|nr:type II toxin-antitoxin system prevent-host-death family antitoxin [Fusobacteriaceae bacterium]
MKMVNIHEAKTHLSALVEEAAAGKPFIIAKAGHPMVTVTSYIPIEPKPRIGFLKGQIKIPKDFDRMGEKEIEAMFGEEA